MEELGPGEPLAPESEPTLISDIHNYCDRRCERCRLCDRCSVYRSAASYGDATVSPPQDDPASPEVNTAQVMRSLRQTLRRLRQLAETYRLAQDVTAEELEQAGRDAEARHDRAVAHPLVQSAKQYFLTAMPILRALRPLSFSRGDEAVIEAVDTIEAVAHLVASKVFRAISGTDEDDYDPADLQDDANGSAKIARLVIADSRAAWKVLMELGRATADGVPAQLVRRLEEIDAGLAERFPRAMEFVRPGFDEGAAAAEADAQQELAVASEGSHA